MYSFSYLQLVCCSCQIEIYSNIFQIKSYKIQNNIIKNAAKCLDEINSCDFLDLIRFDLENIWVINVSGRNINNLRYADDTILVAKSEELKSLLMKGKEESEKVGLRLNIQETKIMASGPITSWQINGETVETVADFIFLGSKITADGDCSHEI